MTSISDGSNEVAVPYLLSESDYYFFETPFVTTGNAEEAFNQCSLQRPADPEVDAVNRMFITNHFLQQWTLPDLLIPAGEAVAETNTATATGSVGAQVEVCMGVWVGRPPNFVLVDFFDEGENVFEARAAMNGFLIDFSS